MKKIILFIVVFAACAGAKAAFAADATAPVIDPKTQAAFNGLSVRAYNDMVCGPTLMTANLSWVADRTTLPGTVPAKPNFPRNTACIVTQSYVRIAGAQLQSRETFEYARTGIDSAATVEAKTITPGALTGGEVASQSRVHSRTSIPFSGMNGIPGNTQRALFAAVYGWEKADAMLSQSIVLDADATSTWNNRLAGVVSLSATGTPRAENAMQNADGSMWSFVYQGKTYVNGLAINDGKSVDNFVFDTKHSHWAYAASSTVSTDRGTYGPYADAVVSDPWLLADGTVMYVVEKNHASSTVQTLYRDDKPVAIADEIGIAAYLPNAVDIVYSVRTDAGWSVVANNTPSQNWMDVRMLRIDPERGSVAYVATGKDEKKNIVFNSNALPISWTPTDLEFNGGNHQPYAFDATGRFWTPAREWKYTMAPDVRAADSHGRILAFTTLLGQYMDMWVDDAYIGRFAIPDEKNAPPLSVKKELDPYFPGFVMTYGNKVAFDSLDQLVIYRQEGRVFTRTAYRIK